MATSELWIREHNLELYRPDLVFGDDLPVVVGYLRVSTDDQVDEGHSLAAQPKFIREACARRFTDGCHLVFVADEGLSGKLPFWRPGLKAGEYRPGLTLVLDMIRKKIINYIAVYKCNRFSRSPRVYLEIYEDYLVPYDVEFFTAVEPIDNRTAAGKYITNILMISSDFERRQILQVCRDGQLSRIEEGYTLGTPGYGWEWEDRRLVKAASPRKRVGIQPVTEQALVVRQIIDWFMAGRSIYRICRELERSAVKSPTGQLRWDKSTVMRILRNPHHAGLAVNTKGELVHGAHYDARIIEETDYHAITDRLARRAAVPSAIQNTTNHLYGELIRCGRCGSRMRLITAPNRCARYRCTGKATDKAHPTFSVRVDILEDWITGQICEASRSSTLVDTTKLELVQIVDAEDDALASREKLLSDDLARNKGEFIRWARSFSRGEITKDEFDAYNTELQKERSYLDSELETTRQRIAHRQVREIRIEMATKALSRFNDIWQALGTDEKRSLADNIIDYVTLGFDTDHVTASMKLILGDVHTLRIPRRRQAYGLEALSASELETAHLLAQSFSPSKISRMRRVSIRTVYKHRKRLVELSGADDLAGAIDVFRLTVDITAGATAQITPESSTFATHFTDRQIQFLKLLADVVTNRSLAAEMGVCITTAADLRRTVFAKLGASSRQEALNAARQRHIIAGTSIWSHRLTLNQLVVLTELVSGLSQPAVAQKLGLSLSAVKERVRCMFRKLGVCCVADLIAHAQKDGWI